MVFSLIAGNGIDAITSKFYATVIYQHKQGIYTSFFERRSYTHEILRGNRTVNLICSSDNDNFRNGIIKIFCRLARSQLFWTTRGPLSETDSDPRLE